jgi:hypothetical protein
MRALVSRLRELPPQPLAGRARADCKADGRSRHEEQVRADPNLKAERLVKVWNGLEAQHRQLGDWEQRGAREKVEERIRSLVGELKGDPQLESILRQRQQELGIDTDSRLMKVVRTRSLKRALGLGIDDRRLERGLSL